MGGAADNAIISPWFVHTRPAALSMAYNGASIGGVVFSPLWVAGIGLLGFPLAAGAIGVVMALTMWVLADRLLSRTPQQMGLRPDNDVQRAPLVSVSSPVGQPRARIISLARSEIFDVICWHGIGFVCADRFDHASFFPAGTRPRPRPAALAMGLATASAIVGRTLVGWVMPVDADRRVVASASYVVQIAGSIAFIVAAGTSTPLLFLGVVLLAPASAMRRRCRP